MPKLAVLIAQTNPIVGNIEANTKQILSIISTHQSNNDIIIFPNSL